MKKLAKFLRFLALVALIFLAITMCFVFNKILDQKIEAQQQQTIEAIEDIKANQSNE